VTADVLDGDRLSDLRERAALVGMLIQKGAKGVDHLLPDAVADGEGDVRSGDAAAADLGRILECSGRAVRQDVEVASEVNLPGGGTALLHGHAPCGHEVSLEY
jgi:hypothetical protein